MVRGGSGLPGLHVYLYVTARCRKRRGHQDVINAPAPIVLECISKVIPIRVLNAVGVKLSKGVGESPLNYLLKCIARINMEVDIVYSAVGMIDVNWLGGYVQVAEPNDRV